GRTLALKDAGSIVRGGVYGYNKASGSYEFIEADEGGVLQAGRGYWGRAFQPCALILNPSSRAAPGSPRADTPGKENTPPIVAQPSSRMDRDNCVPLDAAARSRAALDKPPYPGDYVAVRFLPTDEVTLPADTRAAVGNQNFIAFQVETDHANADVVLQFPNVS